MTDWYQTSLLQREVVELRVRVGIIPSASHAQAMVELLDPTTGVLIAQWSNPHTHSDRWVELLAEAQGVAKAYLAEAISPF